jgi:hypothetical protein
VPLTRATLLYLKTFTLKRISQPLSMALPLLSGVLSLLSRLRDLLHLLLVRLVGIALWLRLEIRACRPSLSILMSSARVSAHLLNMLLSAQRAHARSLLGLMVSLHDPPPTALARLVLLALPHLVQALCAVACHRRQRRIMWRPARTIPNRHNLLLSLLRHNSRRPLPTRRSHLSSRSQPAFLTPTMARMLALPASHRLHRHHLLGWPDLLVRRPLALSHLTDAQAAHLQKCDPSLRTVLALHATATKDRTRLSTTLIPLLAVVLPAAHLPQLPLLLRQKLQPGTVRIVPQLLHRNGTGSGKRVRSCRAMTRNARSSRSLTAVARLLRTMPRRHRFRVKALKSTLTLDASMMATTLPKLLTTHLHWHQSGLLKCRPPCRGCLRHPHQRRRRLVLNIMSQPLVT